MKGRKRRVRPSSGDGEDLEEQELTVLDYFGTGFGKVLGADTGGGTIVDALDKLLREGGFSLPSGKGEAARVEQK